VLLALDVHVLLGVQCAVKVLPVPLPCHPSSLMVLHVMVTADALLHPLLVRAAMNDGTIIVAGG
jgi:hypothetical protein